MSDETTSPAPPPADGPPSEAAPASPPPPATWDGEPDGSLELDWRWLDDPANVKTLLRVCYGLLAILVIVDLVQYFGHFEEHHSIVFWQDWPLGYALYGGLGCAAIILVCKMWFGPILKRKDGYYD